MRIVGGKFKSRRFSIPKNFPSRPTTDFAKEGLFNILEHQYPLENLQILDLCAGTGNISMEFLSREAGNILAIDQNFNSVRHIKSLVKEFGCEDELVVIKSEITKFLNATDKKFDLIFADPPFAFVSHAAIAEVIFERNILNENGVLIIEHGKELSMENTTHFSFVRMYGNVHFSFFEQ